MIRSGPEIRELRDDEDAVRFAVCVSVDGGDMPGVSVKPVPGNQGSAAVLSATVEQSESGDERVMRFDVEAERSAEPWQVSVVVTCAGATIPLAGPHVAPKA